MPLWFPTGDPPYGAGMVFEVVLRDGECEEIHGADTYRPEGPLTTFFRTEPGRGLVDAWADRVASYRTAEICRIRRHSSGFGVRSAC